MGDSCVIPDGAPVDECGMNSGEFGAVVETALINFPLDKV